MFIFGRILHLSFWFFFFFFSKGMYVNLISVSASPFFSWMFTGLLLQEESCAGVRKLGLERRSVFYSVFRVGETGGVAPVQLLRGPWFVCCRWSLWERCRHSCHDRCTSPTGKKMSNSFSLFLSKILYACELDWKKHWNQCFLLSKDKVLNLHLDSLKENGKKKWGKELRKKRKFINRLGKRSKVA